MTGYESKKAAASAKTIDEVNWADHEPNGLAQPEQEPMPCCGKYETCTQACTPRGLFLGKREALAEQEPVDDYIASIIAARDLLDAQPVPDFSYIKTYETKSPKN